MCNLPFLVNKKCLPLVKAMDKGIRGMIGFWNVRREIGNVENMRELRHVDTNKYLGGSSTVKFTQQNCGGGCPIMNHLESFARGQKDDYSNFKVEMGVHLSK